MTNLPSGYRLQLTQKIILGYLALWSLLEVEADGAGLASPTPQPPFSLEIKAAGHNNSLWLEMLLQSELTELRTE